MGRCGFAGTVEQRCQGDGGVTVLVSNAKYIPCAWVQDYEGWRVVMTTPTNVQIGGDHYKTFMIQPIEFIHANHIPYMEANVIKYICRHKNKSGKQDLEKARHYIDLLIQLEYGDEG